MRQALGVRGAFRAQVVLREAFLHFGFGKHAVHEALPHRIPGTGRAIVPHVAIAVLGAKQQRSDVHGTGGFRFFHGLAQRICPLDDEPFAGSLYGLAWLDLDAIVLEVGNSPVSWSGNPTTARRTPGPLLRRLFRPRGGAFRSFSCWHLVGI